MNKFESLIADITKEAATIKIPDFKDSKDLAKWIKKQNPKSKISDHIVDQETGEILFDKNQKLSKYQIYRLYNILMGFGSGRFDRKDSKLDPRDGGLLFSNDLKKYYKITDRKNGNFVIYRSDNKSFYPYDEENIEDIINQIIVEENEEYKYDDDAKGFKEGTKYYKVVPKGINKKYVLNNFEDYYDIKEEKLGEWMEDSVFDDVKGVEYSEDTQVPHEIIKKDKTKITDDDFKIIEEWIKDKNKYLKRDDGIEMGFGSKSGNKAIFEPSFTR